MWQRALVVALHHWPWGLVLGSIHADGHVEWRSKQGCSDLYHLGGMHRLQGATAR